MRSLHLRKNTQVRLTARSIASCGKKTITAGTDPLRRVQYPRLWDEEHCREVLPPALGRVLVTPDKRRNHDKILIAVVMFCDGTLVPLGRFCIVSCLPEDLELC
ncbi:MAG: hypothetical protein KGJ34_01945 [Patescibacteria group bacterium]|nr:hypothetical protein [Patescibacteria group bacterium]